MVDKISDAADMREAAAKVCDARAEELSSVEGVTAAVHVRASELQAAACRIRALPLPEAPAATCNDRLQVGAEDVGLRIAERIREELTSGRQWSLGRMDADSRTEFEAEITSTCVAVCEQEFATPVKDSLATEAGEVHHDLALLNEHSRKACEALGVNGDEIVDPYGPVRKFDKAAYYIMSYANKCALTKPQPAATGDEAGLRDVLKELAKDVFIDAATQVHYSWIDGTNGSEPDFGEAAADYVESFADAYVEMITAALSPGDDAGSGIGEGV